MIKIKMIVKHYALLVLVLVFCSCSVTKSTSDSVYAEAWQKVLKSQAWKDALKAKVHEQNNSSQEFYASTDETVIIDDLDRKTSFLKPSFETKYDRLVNSAYMRIIAQAEKADVRLEKEYILRNNMALRTDKKKSKDFNEKLELINKRYHLHREMLEGLKSWNIFSPYGTDDLAFFKAENQDEVKEMFLRGKSEAAVINFLIYKLADLYHF